MTEPRKIGFLLGKDDNGYPLSESEWLSESSAPEGRRLIESIPWYARVVSLYGLVEGEEDKPRARDEAEYRA